MILGDKFGNLKKKIPEVWHGVFRTGTNSGTSKKKLQKFGTGYFARGQIREPQKKNCRSLARGISHGDKFGNLIGTCGRVAADKSDNIWHWHQACEWAMLKKKKLQKFGTGYFARGQIREPQKKKKKK